MNAEPETLRVTAATRGCFHGRSATVDVVLEDGSATLTITDTTGRAPVVVAERKRIEASYARDLIDQVLGLLATRQRLGYGRSTTVFEVSAVWGSRSSRSEWRATSSELTMEVLNEVLTSLPEVKQREARIVSEGHFNIAHALYGWTMGIVKEHSS